MNHLRALIINTVMLVSIANCIFSSDITPTILQDKGVLVESIGNEELLCVINTEDEKGACWFILKPMGHNREIGSNLSALHEVNQILVSPDSNRLAVLSVGEGHPVIEAIDLQKLINQGKYVVLHKIDPYPGAVWIDRWDGRHLIVYSNVPLTLRKEDGRVDANLMLPEDEKFSLDPETGVMESSTFDIKKLIQHYLSNLTHSSPGVRIEAAYAIKALEATDAIPVLEEALKKESDPDVKNAFMEVVIFLKGKKSH